MDALAAWLERFPPATRILIVALISGFLVFMLMLAARPSPRVIKEVEVEEPAAAQHMFRESDEKAAGNLAGQAAAYQQTFDQQLSLPHTNPNEAICLNGLRYAADGYLADNLQRLQHDIATSLRMQSEEDERFVDSVIIDTAGATYKGLANVNATVSSLAAACKGVGAISDWVDHIRGLSNQTSPLLRGLLMRNRK